MSLPRNNSLNRVASFYQPKICTEQLEDMEIVCRIQMIFF